jgi:hypothetical protein
MADETPKYLGIGKVHINEAFLNQVASSLRRLAVESSGTNRYASTQSSPTPEEITPLMREDAHAFIKEHFLLEDGDV